MAWKNATVNSPIPGALADIVSGTSVVTNTLSTLFSAITTLLEIAQVFVQDTVEPFESLVDAIITQLEQLINDLFGSGLFMLVVNPFELTNSSALIEIAESRRAIRDEEDIANAQYKLEEKQVQKALFNANPAESVALQEQLNSIEARKIAKKATLDARRSILESTRVNAGFDSFGIPILTPRECILRAVDSFDDLGDDQRPQLSDAANVAAIGFMATAPGLDQFKALIEAFLAVFEIPEWRFVLARLNEVSDVSTVVSQKPDWQSVRLNSFSPMDKIQKTLLTVLATVKGFQITANESIQDLIDIMKSRSEQLDKISDDLEDLANAIGTASGLFVLNVPIGSGGVNRLKNELRDPFLECQKNNYTIMVMFVGGGVTAQPVESLRSLFLGE